MSAPFANFAPSSQPSTISSPATSEQEFKEGQPIAYIYNRTDLVSGIITSINPDSTYDLACNIPVRIRQVTIERGNPVISYKTLIDQRAFLKASPVDPNMQVIKTITSLKELGIAEPDSNSIIKQSSISAWRDSGRRTRIPRLTEFFAPLVGHFFNPSLFFYRINCWRAAFEIRGQGIIPEEHRTFPDPSKKPYYTSFDKCFDRYVKEYHSNPDKWNRVLMEAILPEDTIKAIPSIPTVQGTQDKDE